MFTLGIERLKFPRRWHTVLFSIVRFLKLDGALLWIMLFPVSNMPWVRRFYKVDVDTKRYNCSSYDEVFFRHWFTYNTITMFKASWWQREFDQFCIRASRNHLWLTVQLIIKRDPGMNYICNGNWSLIFLLISEKCILTEISSRNSMSGAGKRQQIVCRWFSVTRVFLRTKMWDTCRIYRLTWSRSRWVER